MKKVLSLVLVILMVLAFMPRTRAEVKTESFEIDGFETYQLQKSRPEVRLYYDIVGYDESQKPIKKYVASSLELEVGTVLEVKTFNQGSFTFRAFVIDGVRDTSWHEYEVK
jgi:hypothetical protein